MALFSEGWKKTEGRELLEEMYAKVQKEPMKRYRFLYDTNAGWVVAKAGEIHELLAWQAEAIAGRIEEVTGPAVVEEGGADPKSEPDDPPGAPPLPVTGQLSSQVDAGGRGRKKLAAKHAKGKK